MSYTYTTSHRWKPAIFQIPTKIILVCATNRKSRRTRKNRCSLKFGSAIKAV